MGGIPMLVGTYEHRMDSKGRVVLPSKLREEIGDGAFATIGIDRCVSIYAADEWKKVLERLGKLPFSKGKARDFSRLLMASAYEVQFDASGRILVPPHLRSHACLKQNVTIIGVGDHIELWDTCIWNEYMEKIRNELPNIAEEVEGL
jgi:MraZ protein